MWYSSHVIDQGTAILLFVALMTGLLDVPQTTPVEPIRDPAIALAPPVILTPAQPLPEYHTVEPVRAQIVTASTEVAASNSPVLEVVGLPAVGGSDTGEQLSATLPVPVVTPSPPPSPTPPQNQAVDDAADAAIEDLIKQIEFELDSLEGFDPLLTL